MVVNPNFVVAPKVGFPEVHQSWSSRWPPTAGFAWLQVVGVTDMDGTLKFAPSHDPWHPNFWVKWTSNNQRITILRVQHFPSSAFFFGTKPSISAGRITPRIRMCRSDTIPQLWRCDSVGDGHDMDRFHPTSIWEEKHATIKDIK